MTILVTGAAGFIGSNFIRHLNSNGVNDIVACDWLTNGRQFTNLLPLKYSTYVTPDKIDGHFLKHIKAVYHFGAVSSTTEWNGELVMERNYNYTVELISNCVALGIPVSYSSSASVYGNGQGPLNLYAYSKWLVDRWIQDRVLSRQDAVVQGFRYFNVWGPGEWHKGSQASPYWQFKQQALETGVIKVFEGSENYKRDFVHVDVVCGWQLAVSKIKVSGIWDLGTGGQTSFLDVAKNVAEEFDARVIEIPFPEHLKEHYQYSTRANMEPLNTLAANHGFTL